MKGRQIIVFWALCFLISSCQKKDEVDIVSIEAYTNIDVNYLSVNSTNWNYCPQKGSPAGSISGGLGIEEQSSGQYFVELSKYQSDSYCLTIVGIIPAKSDSSGVTKVEIRAFLSKNQKTVGYKTIELSRPHPEYYIFYQFKPSIHLN